MLHAFYEYRNEIANDHSFNEGTTTNNQERKIERGRNKTLRKKYTSKFCLFVKIFFFFANSAWRRKQMWSERWKRIVFGVHIKLTRFQVDFCYCYYHHNFVCSYFTSSSHQKRKRLLLLLLVSFVCILRLSFSNGKCSIFLLFIFQLFKCHDVIELVIFFFFEKMCCWYLDAKNLIEVMIHMCLLFRFFSFFLKN